MLSIRTLKSSAWPTPGLILLAAILLLLGGCRNQDLLEAQLRARDNDLRELREELEMIEGQNTALEREVGALRGTRPGHPVTPEIAGQTYSLKSIQLGRSTGGLNDDSEPGDEALQVLVEPRDLDDHTIKTPGALTITVFEITPEGLKTPLSSWRIPPGQLRKHWRNGLLSTGYYLVLPWKVYPSSEKLRIVVQLTLSDSRVYEADKDVTIKLVPEKYRKKGLPQSDPVEQIPPGEVPLPYPRKEGDPCPDQGPEIIGQYTGSPLIRAVHLLNPVGAHE